MAESAEVDHCFVVASQSIHRIQESQAILGYQLWATRPNAACGRHARTAFTPGGSGMTQQIIPIADVVSREDRVLEKIQNFRKRRPRLIDDVITLAHGAGGKSSAALVDAVFLEAFRNPQLETLGDGAVLTLPCRGAAQHSARDSFVVAPRRFPGGSIGQLAACTAR